MLGEQRCQNQTGLTSTGGQEWEVKAGIQMMGLAGHRSMCPLSQAQVLPAHAPSPQACLLILSSLPVPPPHATWLLES